MIDEKRIREIMARLVAMSPDPPPYPEEVSMARHEPKREPRPMLVFAGAAVAVAALAIPLFLMGGGEAPLAADTTTTTVTDATTSAAEATITSITPATTTTTLEATTSTGPETVTTVASSWQGTIFVYQEPENSRSGNLALVPLWIEVVDPSLGLGDGSYFTDALAAIESDLPDRMINTIPHDVRVVGSSERGGTVVADMNQAFLDVSTGSFGELSLLNQLVYNLTLDDPQASVSFTVNNEPVELFGSHGIDLSDPVDRETYTDLRAPIFLTEPVIGTGPGYRVAGISNVFEANVNVAVVDGDGEVVHDEAVTATCGTGCWGGFSAEIPAELIVPGGSSVRVFTHSAEDGSMTDMVTVPIPEDDIWQFTTGG